MKIDIFGLNLRKKGVGKGHAQNEKQIKLAHYEYINCNWSLWQKIINLKILVPKLKCASIFMKFSTKSKSKKLIVNIILGIDDLVLKL